MFPCDQCDFKATWKSKLFTHIKSVHKGLKFPCDQCDFKATSKSHLIRHIKSIHEGIKFPCGQCDYKATRQEYLFYGALLGSSTRPGAQTDFNTQTDFTHYLVE